MKKFTKLLVLPLISMALTGCDFFDFFGKKNDEPAEEQKGGEEQKEASISLNKTSLALKVGTEATLVATAADGEGSVTWSSSAEAVATVDANGKVVAVSVGTATITASYSGKTATCEVTVSPADAKIVTSVTITPASLTLDTVSKTSATLTPTVEADEGADTTVTWASSNTNVVTVSKASGTKDEAITVTVVGKGTATITATAGSQTANCAVTVQGIDDLYYLSGVQENANVGKFHTNALDSEDEFRGATSNILNVGDDNPVQLKPVLKVRDEETDEVVSQDVWEFDYKYEALEWNGEAYGALSGEYFAFDAQACTFDFNEAAIKKQFKITVIPGGLDEEDSADPENRVSVELKVNNGYNVYSAKELAYANDINFLKDDRQGNDDVIVDINQAWKDFRTANGLSVDYVAPAVFLQADMKITKDVLPAGFFFTEAESAGHPEWVGKMKDATDVYCHYATGGFEFNGNYFHIDTSELPLCVDNLHYDDNVSHATLFKTVLREVSEVSEYRDVHFKNCTYYGNSPRGNNAEDAMGMIFFKINNIFYTEWTDEMSVTHENNLVIRGIFENFNVTRACISFFGEVGRNELVIKDCEVSEGYSNGMYLWNNGNVQFINSKMTNFGGPVIITDGDCDDDGRMDTYKGFHITADDATIFDNKVTGVEPWFTNTMGGLPATKITEIKALDGLVQYNSGGTKSFVKGDNQEMNMIVINYGEIPYLEFKKGDGATIGYDTDSALRPTIDGILALGAPVLNTDNGAMGYYNPNVDLYELQPVIPGALGGEFLDVIYALPAEGFVNNTLNLSIVFGL